jgi:hypothetical protein
MATIDFRRIRVADLLNPLSCEIDHIDPTSTFHITTQSPEFTCFERLPVEVQIMIWKLSLPGGGPRIILVYYDEFFSQFRSSVKPPAALSFCSGSRAAALSRYHLSFGCFTSPGQIYIDFNIDTVLLACDGITRTAFTTFFASAKGVDLLKSFAICRNFFLLWRYSQWGRLTHSLEKFIISNGCWGPNGHRNLRWDFQEQDEEPQDALDSEIDWIVTNFGVWPICGVLQGAVELHSPRHLCC